MTTEEVIQMRIRSIQREIDDLERTKAVMVNEITGLSKNIIWDRARSLRIDSKGRQFRYVEEKKC